MMRRDDFHCNADIMPSIEISEQDCSREQDYFSPSSGQRIITMTELGAGNTAAAKQRRPKRRGRRSKTRGGHHIVVIAVVTAATIALLSTTGRGVRTATALDLEDDPLDNDRAAAFVFDGREHRKHGGRRRARHDPSGGGGDRKRERAHLSDDVLKKLQPQQKEPQKQHQQQGGGQEHHQPAEDARNKYIIDESSLKKVEGNSENGNPGGTDNSHGGSGSNNNNVVMPDLRIINGVSAPETRYPYSASLQYYQKHFCGGSLVAPDVVVTAAHCTTTPARVTLGRYDLDDPFDFDYEERDVTETIVHPRYDKTVVENDLALLVLGEESVHPYVRINTEGGVPSDGEGLVVMGWGDIDPSEYGQMTSDVLRETDVWYETNDECEESQGYVKTNDGVLFGSYEGSIRESMLCAHDGIGTTSDACQGDSGGALVKTGPDSSEDVLVGLVSWGFGCADPNFPGVYSRLSAYYADFLQPMICEHSRSPPPYLNCINSETGNIITQAPVPAPAGLLTVLIETDPFKPQDLGWELATVPGGEVIASREMGFYANKYRTSLSEEVMVDPEDFYRFTIFDKDGDGFRGEITVVRGRRYVTADALVHEPGFSSVSGNNVVHGFYVGDSPPRELTLDLTFDQNPDDLAWSVTNVEDDLPLGFKWFEWYGKDFVSAREKIPIYGYGRGRQRYVFTVLDLDGDGMCCSRGEGSFSLFLGDPDSAARSRLIVTGGEFTTDQSFEFEIRGNSVTLINGLSGATTPIVSTTTLPTTRPAVVSQTMEETPGYYLSPMDGTCRVNDEYKPFGISQSFANHEECCQTSWNTQQCLASEPKEDFVQDQPIDPPVYPTQPFSPADDNSAASLSISSNNDGGANPGEPFTYAPVTGSFTCRAAGMACTISCARCGSIKRVASGMSMDFPDKSTIVYTAVRGTDDHPEEPSRLILVESDDGAPNVISCDEGCMCDSVNDSVLGCGLVAKPTSVQMEPIAPSSAPPEEILNGCVRMDTSALLLPLGLLACVTFR
mmetsp:Transcript_5200/g.13019  ORF Transcript_5200/g.13019 Transcript_5200/m.13019 type:complete len:1009 (+) Transcript_5200:105-3131(+)